MTLPLQPKPAPGDREVLRRIELLVLDVDGVLTDGRITYTASGDEIKSFHVRDGSGMKYWTRAGGKLAVISGRESPVIRRRARELDVLTVHTGAKSKLPAYEAVLRDLGCSPDRTAVIGDDLPDVPLLLRCAYPIAVADAAPETRQVAAYVTERPGGSGAVREAIEHILQATGKWQDILRRYFPETEKGSG